MKDQIIRVWRVGDWVRFYVGGTLRVGVVEYIGRTQYSGDIELRTDIGSVTAGAVQECRNGDGISLMPPPPGISRVQSRGGD